MNTPSCMYSHLSFYYLLVVDTLPTLLGELVMFVFKCSHIYDIFVLFFGLASFLVQLVRIEFTLFDDLVV